MRVGPVAFLFLVIGGWVLARAVALWPLPGRAPVRSVAWAPSLDQGPVGSDPVIRIPSVSSQVEMRLATSHSASRLPSKRAEEGIRTLAELSSSRASAVEESKAQRSVAVALAPSTPAPHTQRLSISAWALARSNVSPGLATAGQLGGSQVGIRARYRLGDRVHLAARISAPTANNRGKEAALALDVSPFVSLPLTLMVERRVALDSGGRNAFGVGMFGGLDREVLPRIRLDGYGQVGIVGIRSRDLYADGAVRVERELAVACGSVRAPDSGVAHSRARLVSMSGRSSWCMHRSVPCRSGSAPNGGSEPLAMPGPAPGRC